MTDDQLCMQLEIMLDAKLQMLAHSQRASDIKDLHEWMTQIKGIDNQQQIHLKHMEHLFDATSTHATKRQNMGQYQNTNQYRAPRISGSFQNVCFSQ